VTQDDLNPWQDTPLVQALTASGTSDELSGEGAALAAFRTSSPARRRRGVVRLLGTGATSVALLGVIGGGVAAAAYTRSLPDHVQSFVHDVFAPIGVPAPDKKNDHGPESQLATGAVPQGSSSGSATRSGAASASPNAAPSPSASRPSTGPHPAVAPSAAIQPTASASAAPQVSASVSPSPSLSATGPAGDPSTWTMSSAASRQNVRVHQNVLVSGTLVDAAGQPVADQRVAVRTHVPGTTGWQRVAVRRTTDDGSVRARLADLTENRVVVLGAGHGVHSSPLRIVVRPALSVSVTQSSDGTSYIVTVTADGGDAGDRVNVLKHTPQGWTPVGQSQLDSSSSASFAIGAPRQQKRYVVRLPATQPHGAAQARFVLQPLQ
jgi:hypothetical protein